MPNVSVIIRTFNEERYLEELLASINRQQIADCDVEVVIVDSGSTDRTLSIAADHGCRITHIDQSEFTFGRSLNVGCEFSTGSWLVFVSGHCIPCDERWLSRLIEPLKNDRAEYVYGKQTARDTTKFSEEQLFLKYFPLESKIPQEGYFCNNANAAITRSAWEVHKFDENLTGLEDLQLGKRLVDAGGRVGYVADAAVYHIHDESWGRVKIRYEREAVALQHIEPRLHFNVFDFLTCTMLGIWSDGSEALKNGQFLKQIGSIFLFRLMQYLGVYAGHRDHLKASSAMKKEYFYPTKPKTETDDVKYGCPVADEGQQ